MGWENAARMHQAPRHTSRDTGRQPGASRARRHPGIQRTTMSGGSVNGYAGMTRISGIARRARHEVR